MGAAVVGNAFGIIVVEYGLENKKALRCIFIPMELEPNDVKIVFHPPL